MTSQRNSHSETGSIPYRPHHQVGETTTVQRTVIRGNAISHSPIDTHAGSWSKPPVSMLEEGQRELHDATREHRSNFVFFLVVLGVALVLGAFLAQLMFPSSAWEFDNNGSKPNAEAGKEFPPFVLHDLASLNSSNFSGVA